MSGYDLLAGDTGQQESIMKKISSLLILIFCALVCSCADDPVSKEWEYTVSAEGVTITGYKGLEKDLVVPAIIKGRPVIGITGTVINKEDGRQSFWSCFTMDIKSVMIPETVTSIGDSAFAGCALIETMVIPESVKMIGPYAFYACTKLSKIDMPDKIIVEENAFLDCPELDGVNEYTFSNIPWRTSQSDVARMLEAKGYEEDSIYNTIAELADGRKVWWYDGIMFDKPCLIATQFEGDGLALVVVLFTGTTGKGFIESALTKKYGPAPWYQKAGLRSTGKNNDYDTAITVQWSGSFNCYSVQYTHRSYLEYKAIESKENDL